MVEYLTIRMNSSIFITCDGLSNITIEPAPNTIYAIDVDLNYRRLLDRWVLAISSYLMRINTSSKLTKMWVKNEPPIFGVEPFILLRHVLEPVLYADTYAITYNLPYRINGKLQMRHFLSWLNLSVRYLGMIDYIIDDVYMRHDIAYKSGQDPDYDEKITHGRIILD